MGEEQGTLFEADFNRSLKVVGRPSRLTADAGAVLLRSLLDRLGFPALVERHLHDSRDEGRVRHGLLELLRTAVLLPALGWRSHSDANLLRSDPALRLAASSRRGMTPVTEEVQLASQPTLSRLLGTLSTPENRAGLSEMLLDWADQRARKRGVVAEFMVDLDSIALEVFGEQAGSAWNKHYGCRCYHPLLLRSEYGDMLAAGLRPGNAHTADGAFEFALPALRRAKRWAREVWLRADAGFPAGHFLSALEEEGIRYLMRLRGNKALDALAAPYLTRPAGRPPAEGRTWFHELSYQAGSWQQARRVVLVVLERPDVQQHLFLDHFFLITDVTREELAGSDLLERYRQRGDAERDFGDWKSTLDLSLSSATRPKSRYRGNPVEGSEAETDGFAANEARLLLSMLSANLLRAGAELLARDELQVMTRQRFRQLILKTAGRVVTGGRRITLVIDAARAGLWERFWTELERRYPTRGSPGAETLPTPA